jgi:hypothetical protein
LEGVKLLELLSKRAEDAREKCFSEKQELIERIFQEEDDPVLEKLIKDSQWVAPNVTMQTYLCGIHLQDNLVQTTNRIVDELGARYDDSNVSHLLFLI